MIPAHGLPAICLITSGSETELTIVARLVEAGARWFQLRVKDQPDREVYSRGVRLRERLSGSDALFSLNDRADIAAACGAGGLHLGQEDLDLADARRLLPKACIGVSVHEGVEAARAAEADYVGTGAFFTTQTKADARPLSRDRLHAVQSSFSGPIVGIGGITPDNVDQLPPLGIRHVAISSAVFGVDDPVGAFRAIAVTLAGPPADAAGS
ncbi:MAG: thiamine phosphate synthase [Nitrospirota bacterium]